MALAFALVACSTTAPTDTPAPPRVDTAPPVAREPSRIAVPIAVRVTDLQRALEAAVPRTLWTIDEEQRCIPAQRVLGVKVIPDLKCRVVGTAVRGPITVGGSGDVLTISMPVDARVQARDIGRIISTGTATAAARVRARVRLGMTADWQPTAKVDIDYGWTRVPGMTVLGQRVKFGSRVDPRLARVVADLERDLPRELAKLDARAEAANVWTKGFAVVGVNAKNPPVWLRITPEAIAFDGYRITGGDVRLFLTAQALTETFVGPKPPSPAGKPLPKLSFGRYEGGARLNVPVVASYTELEPVVLRALNKLAKRGVVVPTLGRADVAFDRVTIYGTEGGRIAVGIDLRAISPNGLLRPKGRVWLTAMPINAPGSQRVAVRELRISGATDSPATNLLANVVLSEEVRTALEGALTEDFARDYAEVLGKANAALAAHREGDILLSAALTDVVNGRITAYGQGLHMPVTARGTASLRFSPEGAPRR